MSITIARIAAPFAFLALATATAAPARADYLDDQIYTCQHSKGDTAITACTNVIQSGQLTTKGLGIAYADRGDVYFDSKQYTLAIQDYTQAQQLNPEDDSAFGNRGLSYAALQQYTAAISDLDRALSKKPTKEYYFARGGALLFTQQYQPAIADFNSTLALDPNHPVANYSRGLAYASLGQYSQALPDFTRAIALNPLGDIYLSRGEDYYYLADYANAIRDLDEAIRQNPNSADAYAYRGAAFAALGKDALAKADTDRAARLRAGN